MTDVDREIVESLRRQSEFYENNPRVDAGPEPDALPSGWVICEYCFAGYDTDLDGDHTECVSSGVWVCADCAHDHIVDCGPCSQEHDE